MIKIFDHFWIKITALIFGLLLWLHVATEKLYNYQLKLPIAEIVLDENLTLSQNPPDSLMVVVSATGKQLMRKQWRERGIKIIGQQLNTGYHQLKLTTSNTFLYSQVSDISLEEIISPSNIMLAIDRINSVKVKVSPDIITVPDDGFAVSSISEPKPSEILLTGPRTIVNKVVFVSTAQKEINGLRNDLELTLPLQPPAGYGISLEPDSVQLTIEVVPVKTRVFENIPIVIYNTPTEQNIKADPAVIRIELTGSPSEINLLNRNALIASVDYRLLSPDNRAAVKIDCPSKFSVKNASVDSVTLIIP